MPFAARIADMHVCPMQTPAVVPIPHVGGPICMSCPTVMIGFMPAARVGDMAICVGPPEATEDQPADIDRLLLSLAAEMPASKAAAEAAKMTGGQKQALYRRLLELRDGP